MTLLRWFDMASNVNRKSVASWIDREMWGGSALRVSLLGVSLAPVSFALENCLEFVLDRLLTAMGFASRLDALKGAQAVGSWISPVLLAPILENLVCLMVLRAFFQEQRSWWKGPLAVALMAGLFHSLVYWEPRYLAVGANFFIICSLIANVRNRTAGFWASVIVHSLGNALVLLSLRLA
ncbi:MAG TPA: CPBP family glutamic-type intramembrane protease [Stenotrophomonas sp.]|nr:CPBP family glutamic-type intramembrane protease [Stenotrophomonas sp.]